MTTIRMKLVSAACRRARALIDYKILNNSEKRHEFRQQTILADKSLTKDEKLEAIKWLNIDFDKNRILFNEGTKRICEDCQDECLATLYCEHCVRNYLKTKFSNWTSGNNDIDNLIQKCQMKTISPNKIVEWIPYDNLQNVKYLTKGGCSEIYTAVWIDGPYEEWDNEGKKLKRYGDHMVILKKLVNVESANRSWFEECKSHLTISNKYETIVKFDKPLNSIYGNLPYIAPEVIAGKETTFASDVYSIGMLMWEISSGQPPFISKHNYDLAIKIVNGMRPRIIPGTPLEYKLLMEQCWDADPTKRPDIHTLNNKLKIYLNLNFSNISSKSTNFSISLPEPRNATKEEQEAYYSIELDFDIQNDLIIENKTKRIYFNDDDENFKTVNSKKVKLNNNEDEDKLYQNPNFHYGEQDKTKISNEATL
ncbi:hypothetical protein C1645_821307 [Glomus cerebriforme]|uniref:Protein kinase domain-containing protein n=1 Tax=Glomus cerebriforme TaxID=658196 RepID=A0A397T0F5_9GLOM|nr:hypothetical protein C1645_821307 [Glomus cerebriforme]